MRLFQKKSAPLGPTESDRAERGSLTREEPVCYRYQR
jgi:hypothetical protein